MTTPLGIKQKEMRIVSTVSCRSRGCFSLTLIISVSETRWTVRRVSSDDAFKCGRFDTRDMREGKTNSGTRGGEAVFNLQSLFQFAGFSKEYIQEVFARG